LSPSGC